MLNNNKKNCVWLVQQNGNRWSIKKEGNKRAFRNFYSIDKDILIGKEISSKSMSTLTIYARKGETEIISFD